MNNYDVVIVGGGIIGSAIAYRLSRYKLNILLLEKNPVFANETSRGNSGVIHGGFDAETHKKESFLNVEGNKLWTNDIFKHLDFPRAKVDSLVVGFDEDDMEHIRVLYQRGLDNGVDAKDLKIINREEALKREPNLNPAVVGALLCTSSWAISTVKATYAFLGAAQKNGVKLQKGAEVTKIQKESNLFSIEINNSEKVLAKNIINAAGIYADTLAQMAQLGDFKQTTRRGQYRILDESQAKMVNSICFMVPTKYGKGVVVAPMLDGTVLVGPTAEEGIPKKDTKLVTQEMFELIGNIGKRIIPGLDLDRTIMTFSGSRPIDIETNDFIIGYAKGDKHFINAAGMQSPGISAAPAIAIEIEKLLEPNFASLQEKPNFDPDFKIFD